MWFIVLIKDGEYILQVMRLITRINVTGAALLFTLSPDISLAGAGGPNLGVPGVSTNTPSLPVGTPGGGIGTIPVNPGAGVIATNAVPGGGVPGGGVPGGGVPGVGVPGVGIPGVGIPGSPNINPNSGIPIGGGGTPVSTNTPPAKVQEIITMEMMQEAIRVFTQESRTIRQEAEEGNTRQQHNLAVLYTLGLGVPLDHQTAFKWFNKAANEGLAESQFNVAIALQGGLGTRKDLVTSYKYYILAAAQGTIPSAAGARDYLAQYLNREQIESGQRMARGFLTALERRRYYERRRELETKRMEAIRKGQDPTTVEPTSPEN